MSKEKQIEEMQKVIRQLTFDLRTNMTSVTRFVKMEKEKHPTLTEGQFLDRYLEYRRLALLAVDNILKCLNDNEHLKRIEGQPREMSQYVECSVCGKRLYFDEGVYTRRQYCGIYCSPNCFAKDFDINCCLTPLTKELASRKEVSVKEGVKVKGGAE